MAVVALPLALGFAVTTGMSPSAGLTTAILAGFFAALFGGSRYQVSGPTGAMTVVLIPIVSKYGVEAIPALGLIAGLFVTIAAALKLGTIINRVPWAVVEGFTVGIACVIALQQLPEMYPQLQVLHLNLDSLVFGQVFRLSSFFQLARADSAGSVDLAAVEYAASTDADMVRRSLNSSGLRVWMSTLPAAPPSIRSACDDLCTTMRPTRSDGSRV